MRSHKFIFNNSILVGQLVGEKCKGSWILSPSKLRNKTWYTNYYRHCQLDNIATREKERDMHMRHLGLTAH